MVVVDNLTLCMQTISQEQLAETIDSTNVYVSLFKNGQRQPSLSATILIACRLNLKVFFFMAYNLMNFINVVNCRYAVTTIDLELLEVQERFAKRRLLSVSENSGKQILD